MTSSGSKTASTVAKYKLSRRGKKLQMSDDQRTLVALPKDVPERTWAEILQKEETDLMIFDIREEIIEEVLKICYQKYMVKQNALFTAHCAAEAWLKLINWYFLRHDPGEDPSAYPPCFIPKRTESWIPDELPDSSPKDTWCKQELNVQEDFQEEILKKCPSSSSLDMPVIENIPEEYWFPGKINFPIDSTEETETSKITSYESASSEWSRASERLQRVTDYSEPRLAAQDSSVGAPDSPSSAADSRRGAGDAGGSGAVGSAGGLGGVGVEGEEGRRVRRRTEKSKLFSKASMLGRPRAILQPLDGDSRSRISIISDCRLRNLRLDTQYEITSGKIDTPPGEIIKRK